MSQTKNEGISALNFSTQICFAIPFKSLSERIYVLKTRYRRGTGRLLYARYRIAEPKKNDSNETDGVWMATTSSTKRT